VKALSIIAALAFVCAGVALGAQRTLGVTAINHSTNGAWFTLYTGGVEEPYKVQRAVCVGPGSSQVLAGTFETEVKVRAEVMEGTACKGKIVGGRVMLDTTLAGGAGTRFTLTNL
jgi:hypothetical protein